MDFFKGALTSDILDTFKKDFYSKEKNILAQNVCSRGDPFDAAISRKILEETQHVFNYKVSFNSNLKKILSGSI